MKKVTSSKLPKLSYDMIELTLYRSKITSSGTMLRPRKKTLLGGAVVIRRMKRALGSLTSLARGKTTT